MLLILQSLRWLFNFLPTATTDAFAKVQTEFYAKGDMSNWLDQKKPTRFFICLVNFVKSSTHVLNNGNITVGFIPKCATINRSLESCNICTKQGYANINLLDSR